MIKSIKVKADSFEENILLFSETSNLVKVNILFGGNGVGKSTFLRAIKNDTIDVDCSKNYEVISYVNSKDNFRNKTLPPSAKTNDILDLMHAKELSEGQSIVNSFISFISEIKAEASKCQHTGKSLVVLIDEIDSGLSGENINMFIHLLNELINDYGNLQFFISTNSYHFIYIFKRVLDMYTGKFIRINNYEEYYGRLSSKMMSLAKKRDGNFLKHY